MTSRFQDIDLSRLPPPAAIESLDFEAIYQARLADFVARWEAARAIDPTLPAFDTGKLETDERAITEQAGGYREMLLRGRVNDAVKAVMLATAWGTNLDALGARVACARLTGEQDDAYRRRIQIAYEALSTAGPYGAYVWHALSAHPGIKDVTAYGPEESFVQPGEAWVTLLSSGGNGSPTQQEMMAVARALAAWELRLPGNVLVNVWDPAATRGQSSRPLTDKVIVEAAHILTYQVQATILVPPGPDREVIRQAALERLAALAASRHQIGGVMAVSLILSALHVLDDQGQSAVDTVTLHEPVADVGGAPRAAPYCTGIDVTVELSS